MSLKLSPAGAKVMDAVAPLSPSGWLRYDVIERMLPPGVRDVLEVGCGQGALGTRLSTRFSYLGVEPDEISWSIASQRLSAAGAGEVRNIPFDGLGDESFDLVCAFEVLEHIEDDEAAVRDWASRLREHGWLLLSVPAYQHRYSAADELAGHFRRYDPEVLTALLGRCGFEDVRIRHYGAPLGYLLEQGRNQIDKRRLGQVAEATWAERTAGSGRHLQPAGLSGLITRWGTAPFRVLQRAFPGSGPGLVVLARRGEPAFSAG